VQSLRLGYSTEQKSKWDKIIKEVSGVEPDDDDDDDGDLK